SKAGKVAPASPFAGCSEDGMRARFMAICAVAGLTALCGVAQTPQPNADRIFVNGKIWTADVARPQAEAIAVRGEKSVAVGSTEEIKKLAGPATEIADLRGRLVVPGFQDSHAHWPGSSVNEVDLHGAETLEEFHKRLADFAKSHPKLPWITGHGWGYS